jgi:hypothetical protein
VPTRALDELGDDDLAAPARGGDPGRVAHGMAEEVVGLLHGLADADVDADPDATTDPGPANASSIARSIACAQVSPRRADANASMNQSPWP